MAENGGPQIPEEVWESIRPAFSQHYLYESRTLKEVMDIMKRDHNFPASATERMFKTRINKWELDIKTIRHPVWLAMEKWYKEEQSRGHEVYFTLVMTGELKTVKWADIKKHLKRVKPEQTEAEDTKVEDLCRRLQLKVVSDQSSSQAPLRGPQNTRRGSRSPPTERGLGLLAQLQPYHSHPAPSILHPDTVPQIHRQPAVGNTQVNTPAHRSEVTVDHLTELFRRGVDLEKRCDEQSKASVRSVIGCHSLEPVDELRESELITGQWSCATVLSCLYEDIQPDLATEYRDLASVRFKEMLTCGNTHLVLPALSWMSSHLSAISRTSYGNFLDRTVATIEKVQRKNLVYWLPYRYALAALHADNSTMQELGREFEKGRDQCRCIFGDESRHTLVFDFYFVWQLLDQQHHDAALQHLVGPQGLLSKAERIAGTHDLLTLNCLAMTSRAYEEMHDLKQALVFMEDAFRRCEAKFAAYNAYRLHLLDRYASLLRHVSRYHEAEERLREVLREGLPVLGIRNHIVWTSAKDLRDLLIQGNRQAEATVMWAGLVEQFRRHSLDQKLARFGVHHDETEVAIDSLCEFYREHNRGQDAAALVRWFQSQQRELHR